MKIREQLYALKHIIQTHRKKFTQLFLKSYIPS